MTNYMNAGGATLGLGLNVPGKNAAPTPVLNLTNPSPQSVAPAGMTFDEWTLYIKFEDIGPPASTQKLFNLDLDNSNYMYMHYISNGNIQLNVERNDVLQSYYFVGGDHLSGEGDATIAVSGRQDDVVIAVNGNIINTIDDIDMPVGTPDGIGIGQTQAGAQMLSASIRAFKYYNKRLPNYIVKTLEYSV